VGRAWRSASRLCWTRSTTRCWGGRGRSATRAWVQITEWKDFIPALDQKKMVLAPWCDEKVG